MIMPLIHPTHPALLRFSYNDAADGERRRVARHLEGCSRCRTSVSFARRMAAAATAAPLPSPREGLLQSVLAARAAGVRTILPAAEVPAPRPRNTLLISGVAAAAVLLVTLGVLRGVLRRPYAGTNPDSTFAMQAFLSGAGFFAGTASAQSVPGATLPHPPAVTGVDGTRLRAGELHYEEHWTDSAGRVSSGGRQSSRIAAAELGGQASWRIEHVFSGAGADGVTRTEAETLWVDRGTLRPLSRSLHVTPFKNYRRLDITQALNGDSLSGRVTAWAGGPKPFEKAFLRRLAPGSGPLVTDALSPVFLSSVALGSGWSGSLAVLGWAVMDIDVLHPVTLRVTGTERVTVPAGTFDCWRMTVNMDGHEYLAWVRQSDGVGVRTWDESARGGRGIREVVLGSEVTAAPAVTREFSVDAGHSEVGFEIPFLYGKVRGSFDEVRGAILLGPSSSVAVVIGAASLRTGSAHRDEHLKSDDFFDAARYPVISFSGRMVTGAGGKASVTGPLTMHGITKQVTIPFTMTLGPTDDPHGITVVGFEATLMLARRDFGILGGSAHNDWFDKLRSATMGDSARITLEVHGWAADPLHPDAGLAQSLRRVDSAGVSGMLERFRAFKARDSAGFAGNWYGIDQVGRALLARGRAKDGLALLEAVAELLPALPGALVSAGVAREVTGDQPGAVAWYWKAMAVDSLDPRARARLGRG